MHHSFLSSDEENTVPDISALKSFSFEPEMSLEEQDKFLSSNHEDEVIQKEGNRIGNNNWCKWGGHCRPMSLFSESLCCKDNNEIPDDYFESTNNFAKYKVFHIYNHDWSDIHFISLTSFCLQLIEIVKLNRVKNKKSDKKGNTFSIRTTW